jgi:hypothetical protein
MNERKRGREIRRRGKRRRREEEEEEEKEERTRTTQREIKYVKKGFLFKDWDDCDTTNTINTDPAR